LSRTARSSDRRQARYDRLTDVLETFYGQGLGSHYQAQGLKLSKHFCQE